MLLGDRIREAREKAGLTQEELARKLRVSARTVIRLEKGETQRIDVKQLREIASSCGVPLSFLVKGKEEALHNIKEDYDLIAVPLISPEQTACCGAGLVDMDTTYEPTQILFLTRDEVGKYDPGCPPYALHTDGISMEGFGIPNGSIVFVNPREGVQSFDICLVSYFGKLAIKKIAFRPDGNFEIFSSDGNSKEITKSNFDSGLFEIRGKVIAIHCQPLHGRF